MTTNSNIDSAKPSRDYSFDFIKGVLIFLMVYGHVIGAWSSAGTEDVIFISVYTFHMPLFIFVSGYFAGRTLNMPVGDCTRKTWLHLLRPALIWTAISFLIIHLFKAEAFGSKVVNSMRSVWFLYCLGYLYLLGCCIWKLHHKYMLALLVALLGYAVYRMPGVVYLEYFQPIRQWPLFVLGLFYAEYKNRFTPPICRTIALIAVLSYTVAIGMTLHSHGAGYILSHENYLLRAVIYITGAVMVFCLLKTVYAAKWIQDNTKFIVCLGQNTMGVYVMNGLLIALMNHLLPTEIITTLPLWVTAVMITALLYVVTVFIKRNKSVSKYLLGEIK